MAYDVLDGDLFEDSKTSKRRKNRNNAILNGQQKRRLSPFIIHILLVLIIIGLLIFFLMPDNSNSNFKDTKIFGKLTILGDLSSFNESYVGNLSFSSSKFTLITKNAKFDDSSRDFNIENFNGNIFIENNSVVFSGIAQKIEYGKNEILLNGESFKLISLKKTKIDLYFSNLDLVFDEGRVVLDDGLNYEFKNSSFEIKDFNTTFSYDGTYSFVGITNNFVMKNSYNNLKIVFDNREEKKLNSLNESKK